MTDAQRSRPIHPWVQAAGDGIRFGISIFPQPVEWPDFIRLVRRIEELGFDSYWSDDHPMAHADCWTALTALATATSRIRLGSLVNCVYYRGPALLARMAADVDRLSGGRLILGLGIGDSVEEFAQLGIPFPPVQERQRALAETIEIVTGLWREETFTYHGASFNLERATGRPGPVQRPHVPILIAGGGERVTLRQVARYADASNLGAHAWIGGAFTTDDLRRKYDALRRHLEAMGRPYDSVLRSHFTMPLVLAESEEALRAKLATMPQDVLERCRTSLLATTPVEAVAFYHTLAAAGVQYVIANILHGDEETITLLGRDVMPAFVAA